MLVADREHGNFRATVALVCDPEQVTWEGADPGSIIAAAMSSPLQWELMFRLNQALELTDGLRHLCDIVATIADRDEYAGAASRAEREPSAQRVTPERRTQLREWIDTIVDGMTRGFDDLVIDESMADGLTAADVMADPFGVVSKLVDFNPMVEKLVALAREVPAATTDEAAYTYSYLRYRGSSPWTPMVLRALFVTAISSIEPLVSRFVQILVQNRDPATFPSLADETLEQEVRKLCFGPPARWRKVLVEDLGIIKAATAVDWNALEALWEDRNVVVHRGGLVDKRHSANTGTEQGTVVLPTAERVREVADLVGGIRYGLTVAVWDHLMSGAGAFMASQGGILLADFLRSERWALAAAFAQVETAFASDEVSLASANVSRWLAAQRGDDLDVTRAEVEAWDVSGLPSRFSLAKTILLGQHEAALAQLAGLRTTGEITDFEVDEWPIFERLRREDLI